MYKNDVVRQFFEGNITCYATLHAPTRAFNLTDIVAREPPSPAIEHSLPPAAVLLTSHADDVPLGKGELILVGLLEIETRLHQQLLSTVF